MFKRLIFIFIVVLLITVGALSYARRQDASTSRFLVLNNVPLAMYNNQPSSIIFIHPHGTLSSIWRDDLFTSPAALQWSNDGRWLYYAGFPETKLGERTYSASKILRLNTDTNEIETLATGNFVYYANSSGQWAYRRGNSLFDSTGAALTPDLHIVAVVHAPQSDWLFYIAEHGDPPQYDIGRVRYDGTGQQQITNNRQEEYSMAVSDDGEWVAYHRQNFAVPKVSKVEITNVRANKPIPIYETSIVPSMAWSPTAQYFVFIDETPDFFQNNRIWLVERRSWQRIFLTNSFTHFDNVLWSLDEKWIYFTRTERSTMSIYRIHTQTKVEELLYEQSSDELTTSLAWSPLVDEAWHPTWLFLGGVGFSGCGLAWFNKRHLRLIHSF